jgi:crotonobetainyl-CoA:carnitine CoA-transferase CaiB-like acyl-CoA transferase
MSLFRVAWEIEIEADNHLEAAQKALDCQKDPFNEATQFYVQNSRSKKVVSVDLQEDRGKEVLPVKKYESLIKN